MIDLKECGLPVAVPYRSRRDCRTETVSSAQGKFVAACFEHLDGVEPDPANPELWTDQMFEQLGAVTAKMHQASYDAAWTQATLPRRTWREESVAQNFHFYVPVGEKAVHEAFDRVLAKLDALPRSRDAYGLIHADLNHANFFLTPGRLNVFDFDDSCYCWFAYDLIVPIFHFPGRRSSRDECQGASTRFAFSCADTRAFAVSIRAWLKWLPLAATMARSVDLRIILRAARDRRPAGKSAPKVPRNARPDRGRAPDCGDRRRWIGSAMPDAPELVAAPAPASDLPAGYSPVVWLNLLCLDAPIVAVTWQWLFGRTFGAHLDFPLRALAFSDRLADLPRRSFCRHDQAAA